MFSRKQLNLSVLTPEFLDANTFINDENIKTNRAFTPDIKS